MKNLMWNENLKLCRERHGYSQKEISEKLNISNRTLQRYEAGVCEPNISTLLKLSEIYETSIDSIIGNESLNCFNTTTIERYINDIENTCKTLRRELYEHE